MANMLTVGFILLMIMAVLVAFNTIRLAIYNSREEISVMRLVGASNAFIRGPFVIEGVMQGVIAGILALVLLYPATLWVTSISANFFGGIDVSDYYRGHFSYLFSVLILSGLVLGMASSFIAIRRYLDK